MNIKNRVIFSLFLLCAGQTSGLAESKPVELKWTELAPVIQGQRVELVLKQGQKIKGEAVVVREDSIVMDVKKGSAAIPRTSIQMIKLERTPGRWGRNLGTTIGVLTGLSIGGYVAGTQTQSAAAGIPLFLVMSSAVTIAGYYAGRSVDARVTVITIALD